METARGKLGCIIYAQLIRLVFTLDSQKFIVESTNSRLDHKKGQ